MLRTLKITNIALIDELTVDLAAGMNCLTGETGAGKSIVVDSIGMLLGGRVSRDMIRSGEDFGGVKGYFTDISPMTKEALERNGITVPNDGTFTVEREITCSGRNICKINGKTVPGTVLRDVGNTLIDIHGQHDNQSLIRVDSHIKLLDNFGKAEIAPLAEEYSSKLKEFRSLKKQLSDLSGEPQVRARTMDLLNYQVKEITNAQLSEGEEEELTQRRQFFDNSEKIRNLINKAAELLSPDDDESQGATSVLAQVNDILSKLSPYGGEFQSAYESSFDILSSVQELSYAVNDIRDKSVYDAEEADWVNRRLDYIYMLEKKYGNTVTDVLKFAEEAQKKLDFLKYSEENVNIINERLGVLSGELYAICAELHEARMKVSGELSSKICSELTELEMPGVTFSVNIEYIFENDSDGYPDFRSDGLDDVEFMISANAGEPVKPLSHIASGGELSRIMLAIKSILSESDRISTMIFDEIDTGVSGIAAKRIADKLYDISRTHQVVCVTHHAQIAAKADCQLFISKKASGDRTLTSVSALSYTERVKEIARLLDGDPDSEIAIKHAEQLLSNH